MNLHDSRIYKSLIQEPFHKVAGKVLRWTEEGRDVNFRDETGRSYLHVVAEAADKFRDARAVPVVYQLCVAGIDVDAKNADGDTCLHVVVKREGTFRIIVALLRCGADPLIEDGQGRTASDILVNEKPPGWEENLYWLNKFSPGLRNLLHSFKIDSDRIEQLLASWCRVLVYKNGALVNLVNEARKVAEGNALPRLLQDHLATNELAIAVLAGSPKRIKKIGSGAGAQVNTTDKSYRYHYPHSPEVAQPLLAAAWEQNNYDVIDALMSLNPDTSVLYSNHSNKPKKPLFFHLISGRPKPDAVSIIHRVLRSSDLRRRNHKGQSVLFEAIKHRLHVTVAKAIIQYGVSVASRDYKGRTARDYAEELGESDYVTLIDDHVLNVINERKVDYVERLVMMSYDHVTDLVRPERPANQKLCERLEENRLYKEMAKCLDGIPRLQRICKRIHQAVDEGDLEAIRKYSKSHVTTCQNKCGHTVLHRAILTRDRNVITETIHAFPHLLDVTDNMDRSALHYSNLLFGGSDDVSLMLLNAGARDDVTDVLGRTPGHYRTSELTTHEYKTLYKEVVNFESTVILREMSFEAELNKAITYGDLQRVKQLVQEAGQHANMATFSPVLFDCLDQRHPDIATFLLKSGCDPDIWKQYEKCDPTEDLCALGKCRHPVVSLYERCKELDYDELAEYVDELKREKLAAVKQQNHAANAFQLLANYGLPP